MDNTSLFIILFLMFWLGWLAAGNPFQRPKKVKMTEWDGEKYVVIERIVKR